MACPHQTDPVRRAAHEHAGKAVLAVRHDKGQRCAARLLAVAGRVQYLVRRQPDVLPPRRLVGPRLEEHPGRVVKDPVAPGSFPGDVKADRRGDIIPLHRLHVLDSQTLRLHHARAHQQAAADQNR